MENIQNRLPMGYLYLIILGILKESLFYYQLDINILRYSSIMDVLISPIADLTSKPVVLVAVLFMVVLAVVLQAVLVKNSHKKFVQKMFSGGGVSKESLTKEEVKKTVFQTSVAFLMTALFSFFLGTGLSNGEKVAKKIRNNDLDYNYKVSFDDDKPEEIYLIDSNSSYYFYLTKGNKNIKIAPAGRVKNIEMINNKALK